MSAKFILRKVCQNAKSPIHIIAKKGHSLGVHVICIFTCPPPKKNLRKGWEDGSAAKAFDMKESSLVLKPPKTHISVEWTWKSILNLDTKAEDRECPELSNKPYWRALDVTENSCFFKVDKQSRMTPTVNPRPSYVLAHMCMP